MNVVELLGGVTPAGGDVQLLQATVISVSTGRCTIRFADTATAASSTAGGVRVETGSSTADDISGVRYLASVSVSAGDTVWVLRTGGALLIIGKLSSSIYGNPEFRDGLELYHPSSTPYVDFHRATSPAGDSNADYDVRLINDANDQLSLAGGKLAINGTTIYGTVDRNWFKDSELSSGAGLRVGAAWGIYGIYSESGQVVVGSADGRIYLNGQAYGPSIANNTFAECVAGANVYNGGTGLPGTRNYIIQAFTQVQNFTTGNANITFPAAFPRGVLTVVMSNGDSAGSAGGAFALLSTSNYSLTGCGVSCANASNNTYITGAVRMNIVAVGW